MLKTEQIRSYLCVSTAGRPHVQNSKCRLIDERHCVPIDRHIHRFQITATGVTSLHVDIGARFGRITRQLSLVLSSAPRTDNSAEHPLAQTEGTQQRTPAALTFRAKYCHLRKSCTDRAKVRKLVCNLWHLQLQMFRQGLQTSAAEKIVSAKRHAL